MTTPAPFQAPGYAPTAAQKATLSANRQFQRRFVFAPLLIAAIAYAAVFGLLIWAVSLGPTESSRAMASALANMAFIAVLCPLTLLCGLVPGGAIAYTIKRRRQRRDAPPESVEKTQAGRLRWLLWRLDSRLSGVHLALQSGSRRGAEVAMQATERLAFVQSWLRRLFGRN